MCHSSQLNVNAFVLKSLDICPCNCRKSLAKLHIIHIHWTIWVEKNSGYWYLLVISASLTTKVSCAHHLTHDMVQASQLTVRHRQEQTYNRAAQHQYTNISFSKVLNRLPHEASVQDNYY